MHKYGNFFSFYGNKIWLRAGKGIFAVFQSVVCCAFTCRCLSPYVIVAYIKYYFSDNFSHRLLKPIFFFLVMSQEILLTLNSSWNILVLLGCMQVLDTSAASHYSFLCLLFASLPVLKLEGQREKQCKKKIWLRYLHNSWGNSSCNKMQWSDLWSSEDPCCSQGDSAQAAELQTGRVCYCYSLHLNSLSKFR